MTAEQHQLFDGLGPVQGGGRGRAVRPPANGCGVEGCANLRRRVKGALYCTEHAHVRHARGPLRTAECYVCGATCTVRRNTRVLELCADHTHLRKLLANWRMHHVYRDQAREFLANPVCWVCGQSLAWRFSPMAPTTGRHVDIDHDHRCCPGGFSCGACVRGLAHQACNRRIGQLEALVRSVGADQAHRLLEVVTA